MPASGTAQADGVSITDLVAERLGLMKDVAAYKYVNDLPVEDPAREAIVIAHAAEQARDAGLDGDAMVPFFAAQIDAAKLIQQCWIGRWQSGSETAPTQAPDLAADIRPRLIEIGDGLIVALAVAVKSHDEVEIAPLPEVDCLPAEARATVIEWLKRVVN
jgi:chorismate mutase-like protein